MKIACGQCASCRLKKTCHWAMRCVHEASQHEENSFLTLTVDDEHMSETGSLDKRELQKFWKRLRKSLGSKKIRYYSCGEYGDKTKRAHYHACLFGHDFPDKKELRNVGQHTLYESKELTKIWGNGHTSIGDLTFESAAYVASYVMKKQTGLARKGRGYATLDEQTGELRFMVQPFALMSKNLGKEWFLKYHGDIYNADKDFLVMRGKKLKPARYYDLLYQEIDPEHMEIIKANRYKDYEGMTRQELDAHAAITRARKLPKQEM